MKRSTRIYRAILETLENRRLLSFTAPVSYPVGPNPQSVATGDFNGDGRSDVVAANASASNVSVLLSNANGTLQPAQPISTGGSPRSVAVGDVNNDGKRDIVTANGAGNLSVLLGNGNGTLQSPLTVTLPTQIPPHYTDPTPLAQTPLAVAVGDLNADGKLDLVVNGRTTFYVPYTSYYGGTWNIPRNNGYVNVLLGNGTGTFASSSAYLANGPANSVAVADINNDTKLDVVTGAEDRAVWPGNGNGTLQPAVRVNNQAYPATFVIGDFDTDGNRDLIAAGGLLTFLKGAGNGTFPTAVSIPVVGDVRSVVAGDINGDGKLDLVASTSKTTFASYGYYGGYDPTTTEYTKVLLGAGDGTFSRGVSSTVGSYAGLYATNASALGDVNADGTLDLVATDPLTNKVFVQFNQPGWFIPGTLSISDAPTVTEGNSGTVNTVFTVTLAEAPAANVSVDYAIGDGTATLAGGDFLANSGTLTFTPGQTSKTITVQVKGDRVGEFDEYFNVNLTNPINADLIDAQGLGTIQDDEPHVWIEGGQVTEGNSGTAPLTFTVKLSAASDAPVTVTYRTQDYTALGTTDYVPGTGTVTFAPGQTTQTFTVAVKGDLVPENQETFFGVISGATNGLIVDFGGLGGGQAYGTIVDTDPDPAISIANVTRAEGGPGSETSFEFVLSLSKPSEKTVWVQYATGSGTATSSTSSRDYRADSSTATFYPGQMFTSVWITVIGDSRSESDETFFVNLSNPNSATIADNQAVGTILNDETRGKKWIGPVTGGSWSTASNWSPSGVPASTSFVRIENASVVLSSSITVAELSLVGDAALTVSPGGGKVVRTPALFVDYSILNLNDNNLIVDYTAGNSPLGAWNYYGYTGITGMVGFGSNGGHWNGSGIVTTKPDALAGRTTFAVGEASRVLGITGSQNAVFSGQTVDATTLLVRYTYAGDANLDGRITVDDYGRINLNVGQGTAGWYNGDFNYDGKITVDDYGIIDFNVGIQGPQLIATPSPNEVVATADAAATRPPAAWQFGSLAIERDTIDSLFSTADIL